MSTIDEIGYEIQRIPIKKVRVSSYGDKWYVEYRLAKPKYIIDRWWWYDDSTHATYTDAITRAQVLSGFGYHEIVTKKNKIEFDVSNNDESKVN